MGENTQIGLLLQSLVIKFCNFYPTKKITGAIHISLAYLVLQDQDARKIVQSNKLIDKSMYLLIAYSFDSPHTQYVIKLILLRCHDICTKTELLILM